MSFPRFVLSLQSNIFLNTNTIMNVKRTLALISLTMITSIGFSQEKMSEEEIKSTAAKMETDWQFGFNHIIWMENQDALSHYLETVPMRCLDELKEVVGMSERPHEQNLCILQLKKLVYPKPGSKKSESNLALYFTNIEKAKQRFADAEEAERMYQQLMETITPIISAKEAQKTFTIPQGELTYFYYHMGGGMIHRPSSESTLERRKDGTYFVSLDTKDFNKLDTIPVTQAQVDTIRQMLIDGEVYKMPPLYDEPIRILDAPHGSVSVKFTDASFHCNNIPPSNWGGKNIRKVYEYLKGLQHKGKDTE